MTEKDKDMPEGFGQVIAAIDEIKAIAAATSKNGEEFETKMKEIDTRVEEMEKKVKERKVSLPGVEDEKQKWSWANALRGIATKDWTNAGFEEEVFKQTRLKAQNSNTGSAGGFIVPDEVSSGVIEKLEPNSVVIASGATVLPNLMGGSMTFPRQSGSSTAYWRGENTAITESEITLNDLTLRPKSVAALVKMSNEVLARSTPAIDGLIERDMKKQIGKAIDLAALRGSGTEYQPLGIANTTGINTLALGAAGAIFNFDNAIDMEALLEDDDALEGALGYIMHPRVKNLIRKLKVDSYASQTSNQGYHYPPIMSNAKLEEALGFGFKTTTQIPTNLAKSTSSALSEVYFGNWNELFIGQWGGMELKVSDETSDAFEKNQTWIRVIQEVDMGLRHVESFALVSDAATTDPVA